MTTEQLQAAFPSGRSRRAPWQPQQYREWMELRDKAYAAERRAVNLWSFYWWRDEHNDAGGEAVLFQATDLLLRVSGLLMLDAAVIAGGAGL